MDRSFRIDLNNATGNFWIDLGITLLHEKYGDQVLDPNSLLEQLTKNLLISTGNKGVYYDKNQGQLVEYEKVNWAYPANVFISVAGRSKKITVNGKKYPTSPPVFEMNLKLRSRHDICDLCGTPAPTTDAKMWMFPFLTAPDKFSNFYSFGYSSGAKGRRGKWRSFKLCPRCALAGFAAHQRILWKSAGRTALHLFVFHSDLQTLASFYREILDPIKLSETKGGNIPTAFSGPYPHETALGFLLELFNLIHQRTTTLSAQAVQLLSKLFAIPPKVSHSPKPLTLYVISGVPGQSFQMQKLQTITKLQALYQLYERFLNQIRQFDPAAPTQRLHNIFRQFSVRWQGSHETIWRDRVAWAILEFNDPLPPIEEFLFEIRAKQDDPFPLITGTVEIVSLYIKERFQMTDQLHNVLAGFGHSLGSAAFSQNEMGILYALRNAKNPESFLQVLNDAQFRLGITIPSLLLKIDKAQRIENQPWIRVKTLLSIYAMNAYLRKGTNNPTTTTTEE